MFDTSSGKFAALFNEKYPGAYRKVTAQDVRDMTTCCLIGRYGFYLRDDLELVRGVLQYEQMREKRSAQPTLEDSQEPPKCKRCKQSLRPEPEGKRGRLREYCPSCEPFRNTERYRKWRKRKERLLARRDNLAGIAGSDHSCNGVCRT